jgi:magnesium-transporting ATPase (P-type)
MMKKVMKQVDAFSSTGLRTLAVAYRELSVPEYKQLKKEYLQAVLSIQERERHVQTPFLFFSFSFCFHCLIGDEILDQIEEVAEKVERNLILIGATAIEDKLQVSLLLFSLSFFFFWKFRC